MAIEQLPPLSVPPADAPPLVDNGKTGSIFDKLWWLYFINIKKLFQAVQAALNVLQAEIDAITPGTFSSYISDLGVLSGGPTNITSPVPTPNEGDLLTVFWQQPAAGNEQITWDAIFQQVTVNDNDKRPNRTSAVSFKAKADNMWYPVAILMGRL